MINDYYYRTSLHSISGLSRFNISSLSEYEVDFPFLNEVLLCKYVAIQRYLRPHKFSMAVEGLVAL